MVPSPRPSGLLLASILLLSDLVDAFSYSLSTPTQCGDLTVTWSGGTAPYHVVILPTDNTNTYSHILNVTIPSTATSPYTIPFTEPSGMEFIGVMWDTAGGYAGTRVTDVITVGSSSNSSCLTAGISDQADFLFYISSDPPAQCSSLGLSWDSTYTPPLYVTGYVPGGSVFDIVYVSGSATTTATWTVDVASGTEVLIAMSDAGTYGTGGSSDLMTVGTSSDSSCLNSNSPASIAASSSSSSSTSARSTGASSTSSAATTKTSASATANKSTSSSSATSSVAGSGGNANDTSSGKTPIGGIVGGVVGGIGFLALLAVLFFCCCRRKAREARRDPEGSGRREKVFSAYGAGRSGRKNGNGNDVDLLGRGEKPGRNSLAANSGMGMGGGPQHGEDGENTGLFEPSPYMEGASAPSSPNPAMSAGNGAGAAAYAGSALMGSRSGSRLNEGYSKTEIDTTPTVTNRSSFAPSSPATGYHPNQLTSPSGLGTGSELAYMSGGGMAASAAAAGVAAAGSSPSRTSQDRQSMEEAHNMWLASQGTGGTGPQYSRQNSEDDIQGRGNVRSNSNAELSPLIPAPSSAPAPSALAPGRSNSTRKQPLRVSNPGPSSPRGSLNRGTAGTGTANVVSPTVGTPTGRSGPRYVMHEDAGSVPSGMSDDGSDEVVELPPAYPGPQTRRNA